MLKKAKKSTKKTTNRKPNLHFRRFEFKYHVPRAIADRIIPQMLNYMTWDEYSQGDEGYEVNSLYMDAKDFKCYYEKTDGLMNRKKVRVRNYKKDWSGNDNVFFELKRRSGEVILKDRMVVQGEDFKNFLNDPFSLLNKEEYKNDFLNEFLWEYTSSKMSPAILVKYKRKPFFSKFDPRFRVTFDYDLSFAKPDELNFNVDYDKVYDDLVIMEVKFNGAMPKWFHDIIEMYKLTKDVFSKYCAGVETEYGLLA